jgi:integrase
VPWSSEEARRFLESARADQDVMYAAFVLILVLGLRKGEVLGLRWGAVDLAGRELVIDHQVQRVRRELPGDQDRRIGRDATDAWQSDRGELMVKMTEGTEGAAHGGASACRG